MAFDLLLLFPGVTEARFFPYLSLPMLTGYLRARGHKVAQRDLNLALIERLTVDPIGATIEREESAANSALRAFMLEHGEEIRGTAFEKTPSQFPWQVAADLAWRHALRNMDGSVLTRRLRKIHDVVTQGLARELPTDQADRVHAELLREAIEEFRPRVVGVSVAYFSQILPALRLARQVREISPETTVVFGGPQIALHGRALAEETRIFEFVDALVEGPGEPALDALLKGASDIPGALSRNGWHPAVTHHISENPPPDFEGLCIERYLTDEVQLPVVGTVGCYWGRCTFCSYGNRTLSAGYQQLRPEALADVCLTGLKATGSQWIVFVDENANLKLIIAALRRLAEKGYRVRWASRNRLEKDLSDIEFCRELADAGCRLMSVGYETNVQRLLDRMNKGVDASLYQRIVDNLHEVGIALRFSVMGGLFDETPQEAEMSQAFLVRNANKIGIDVAQMMIVEPTSLLASDPIAHGIVIEPGERNLMANESFSFLGGRVGIRHSFATGAGWDERAGQLAELVRNVLPEKNDNRHVRFQKVPPLRPGGTSVLQLHPWVVHAKEGRLVDLQQALVLRPSQDWKYDSEAHRLAAVTDRGLVVLTRLLQAGFGLEETRQSS